MYTDLEAWTKHVYHIIYGQASESVTVVIGMSYSAFLWNSDFFHLNLWSQRTVQIH